MLIDVLLCLALNVYHEARGEPLKGQFAVAQVTMNRANQDPSRVCEEVFRPHQFSWANPLTTVSAKERVRNADRFMPRDKQAWETAKRVARKTLDGRAPNVVGNADHYHAESVRPRWAKSMQKVARIGGHTFYINRRS